MFLIKNVAFNILNSDIECDRHEKMFTRYSFIQALLFPKFF